MSRKTWKDLALDTTVRAEPEKLVTKLGLHNPSIEEIVTADPKVSALLEEQKRLADNMKRLTGGGLNTDFDPRFPVTALDERRREIENWASKKQTQFQKYKKTLPAAKKKLSAKRSTVEQAFNRPPPKSDFLPNRPLPKKWEENRDRLNQTAQKVKGISDSLTRGLGKFDNKLDSVGRQLSDLREKTGGDLPPELASLDEKLKAAREKSAALKALNRTSELKKKITGNKTLQLWNEKRDQAQNAIRAASTVSSAINSIGSKFNRPAKDAPKTRAKTKHKSEDTSSDLDRRREQSSKKRKDKKAEQDRMDRRNERAKERRRQKKANKYA